MPYTEKIYNLKKEHQLSAVELCKTICLIIDRIAIQLNEIYNISESNPGNFRVVSDNLKGFYQQLVYSTSPTAEKEFNELELKFTRIIYSCPATTGLFSDSPSTFFDGRTHPSSFMHLLDLLFKDFSQLVRPEPNSHKTILVLFDMAVTAYNETIIALRNRILGDLPSVRRSQKRIFLQFWVGITTK